MFVDRHLAAVRVLPVRFRVQIHQVSLFSVSIIFYNNNHLAPLNRPFSLRLSPPPFNFHIAFTTKRHNPRPQRAQFLFVRSYPRTICSRCMRTASEVRLASSRLRAAWISSHVSGRFSTRYLDVVVALMAEEVIMLRECHGELCAVLGVSGVAGHESMVPDLPFSSSVIGLCCLSLVLLVLILVLALVPSTWSSVSSVFWCFRRPLEFGRRL
jgi:hypothetical protein